MKFVIAQILIVLTFLAGIIIFFGKVKKKEKIVVAGLCIITIAAAFISNSILGMIPMPKDRIQLTATGEKNPNALNNEVSLKEVVVDDIHYKINNAVEGKWFWKGDSYMWRNENDSRKPEGVTRSITLEIPKGNSRQFVFDNNQYRGFVEITYNGQSTTYDLYSDEGAEISIDIPGNGLMTAYMIKFGRIALFVLFIAVILAYFVFAALKFDYGVIKVWFGRNWDKLVYFIISVTCFIVMFELSKLGSMWYDEIWVLGVFYEPNFLSIDGVCALLQKIWFMIMPYGQEYLLLLSDLLVALSIYFCGLIGNKINGKRLGVIIASLCATSSTVMGKCGEFRTYSFLLFFTTISVYMFIKKQSEIGNEKLSTLFVYGLFLVLMMDTHLFGLITAGVILIFDFILVCMKRTKIKGLFEFVIPTLYCAYWVITKFFSGLKSFQNYNWPQKPSVKGVIKYVLWLCSNNYIIFSLLVLGTAFAVYQISKKVKNNKFDYKYDYAKLVVISVPACVFVINIIVSSIFPNSSLFVDRYFIPVIVFLFIIVGVLIDKIIEIIFLNIISLSGAGNMSIVCTIALAISVCIITWYSQPPNTSNNYRGTAEYLMSQNDIYLPSTVCIVNGNYHVNIGFEYYLSKKGNRDSINHQNDLIDVSSFDIVYVVYHHVDNVDEYYFQNGYRLVSNDTTAKVKKYVKKS